MTTVEFLRMAFNVAFLLIGWMVIDFLRRILDALHTLVAQGSGRRLWERKE